MIKATFKLKGEDLFEELSNAVIDFQDDEFATRYEFESGVIFMFEQKKRSLTNFALNVILDYSKSNKEDKEFTIQCIAMGAKNRAEIHLLNIEKSTIKDLRAHMFGYSERNNCNWEIEELVFS